MPLDPTLPLGRTLGKEDKAYVAAQDRLDATLTSFQAMGAEASGEVGHKDPVEAARDAMRRPSGRRGHPVDPAVRISRWLGQDAPSRLKAAVSMPVVVVTAAPATAKVSR